jgi:hypothetical protein
VKLPTFTADFFIILAGIALGVASSFTSGFISFILGLMAAVSGLMTIAIICVFNGLPFFTKRNKLLKMFLNNIQPQDGSMHNDNTYWEWSSPESNKKVVLRRVKDGDAYWKFSAAIEGQKLNLSSRDRYDIALLFDNFSKGVSTESVEALAKTLESMLYEKYSQREKELIAALEEHRLSKPESKEDPPIAAPKAASKKGKISS